MYLDQNTGKLYVYATRSVDGTAGVVCVDTTQAATNPNPFCGFTALTPVGDGPAGLGISGTSQPVPQFVGIALVRVQLRQREQHRSSEQDALLRREHRRGVRTGSRSRSNVGAGAVSVA